jgi:hypothetical protein
MISLIHIAGDGTMQGITQRKSIGYQEYLLYRYDTTVDRTYASTVEERAPAGSDLRTAMNSSGTV